METWHLARRATFILLASLLALALGGCSGDKGSSAESGGGGNTAAETSATATDGETGGGGSSTDTGDDVVSSDGSHTSTDGDTGGDASPPAGGEPSAGGDSVEASLKIVVSDGTPAAKKTVKVTCPDPHGLNAGACITLAQSPDVFDPLPRDAMCTQQFGGPETAHVTGTYNGDKVDAKFSRTDGCQISRWSRASPIWTVVRHG